MSQLGKKRCIHSAHRRPCRWLACALRATPTDAECHTDEGFNTTRRVCFCLRQMKARVASQKSPAGTRVARSVCECVIISLRLTSSCGEQPVKISLCEPQRSLVCAALVAGGKRKERHLETLWCDIGGQHVTGGETRLKRYTLFSPVPVHPDDLAVS